MAKTPTLDEIEAAANRIATRKSEWAPEMYPEITAELLRGLVAHVRALEKVTRMTDDRTLERVTALEAKVAAQAGPVIPVDLSEIHAELDRLRAENAELRKRIAELEEWWRCNLCFGSGMWFFGGGN